MKEGQKLWTREELILALNLYYKLSFGRLHSRNPEVKHLAKLIGRTADAVAYKLVNLASLDPAQKARGIKGASNASKLDREIWNEFYEDLGERGYQSEKLLANYEGKPIEALLPIEPEILVMKEGTEKERLVKMRVNQHLFRRSVLASYNNACCLTGLTNPALLIASHIIPWSKDEKNRLHPANGLCLNALHDKAFDNYLITVTQEYKVVISKKLRKESKNKFVEDNFLVLDGKSIILPDKFPPSKAALQHHNECFYNKND